MGRTGMPRPRVESPARAAADRRARRRCLRDRRGPCRSHRRAGGGAARLVGRRAGGAKASPGTPRAATPASCCRDLRPSADALIERVGLDHAKALWALFGGRRRICAQQPRRDMPGVGAERRRLAACVENRRHRARWRTKPRCWPASSARRSSRGRPSGCARRCIRRAISTGCTIRAAFQLHPLNYALGLAAAAEAARRAHLRGYAGAGDRSGRRAQARRHQPCPRPRGACRAGRQRAPRRACAAVRQHAAAGLRPPSSSPRRSATNCAKPSAIPAR